MKQPFERLFFALWPDASLREQITGLRKALPGLDQGRLLVAGNLHLTLHFLGNIELERIDCFLQQAGKVKARSFSLELDTPGYFKRPQVAWLGCQRIPTGLVELHRQLGEHIENCGFKVEHRAYSPHMTLARKIRKRPELPTTVQALPWQVNEFVLIKSVSVEGGVEYRVRESFPLQPA
ncbi:MAG: RNA 2',3'-cyclic phosphodiesterase [Gammaproteobacteria bacterium]|nr:RNA 2',3'-cyclic phosphodiesterase [Gammaproteobacteria bacterium]